MTVTSADSDEEVEFEGAFVVNSDDEAYHSANQKTPYEFKTSSMLISGVFHCVSADSRIKVEITIDNPVRSGMSVGSGTGTIIIIGRGMGEHINDYIYVPQ